MQEELKPCAEKLEFQFSQSQPSFRQVQQYQQQYNQEKLSQDTIPVADEQKIQQNGQTAQQLQVLCRQLSTEFAFSSLYDWQKDILLATLQGGDLQRNVIINSSTASGKTHLVSIYILKVLLQQKKSCIFIVPYIALVDELTGRFKELLPSSCCLCSLTGLKPLPQFINNKPTVFIVTIEKGLLLFKQMLQNQTVHRLGLVVADEVHVCCDENSERSARLELLLTYMRCIQKMVSKPGGYAQLYEVISDATKAQQTTGVKSVSVDQVLTEQEKASYFKIIAMSATLDNADDFGHWLDAELFKTQFRQSRLQELIYCNSVFYSFQTQGMLRQLSSDSFVVRKELYNLILTAQKPLIVFCGTKKACRAVGHELAQIIHGAFSAQAQSEQLTMKRESILAQITPPFQTQLQEMLLAGVCFHTSELPQQDRQIVEEAFRDKTIHTLIATTTLAAGVNLPATTVIINGLRIGTQNINQQYYRQMAGRAGRIRGKDGASILYLQDKADLERAASLREQHKCMSQILSDGNLNNSINWLLMLSYELKQEFLTTYQSTLAFNQYGDFQVDRFKNNIQRLISFRIIHQDNNQSLYLTKFGKAINDAGVAAENSYYYYQLIEQIKKRGFDIFDDDMLLLVMAQHSNEVYHQFNPERSFVEALNTELSLYKINYEQVGQVGPFVLGFLDIDAIELNDLLLVQQISNKVKFYIAYRLAQLKQQLQCYREKKYTIQDDALKSMVSMAGQLTIFCQSYQLKQLQNLIYGKLQEVRELLMDDITDLLAIRYVGTFRARILKQSGFNNAAQIVQYGVEKLKLLLNFGDANDAAVQRVFDGAVEACQKVGL